MKSIKLINLHNKIGEVEFLAKELNNKNSPFRLDELSSAITKLQEARMWVKEAKEVWEGNQPGIM